MTLGWGIVGIGRHADWRMAPAIRSAQGAGLVAVCSRDPARASAFAAKHGATRSYSDFGAMLRDDAIDVVYIATPNSLHASQTIEAAEAGKHVLCEKPMALSTSDCEAMIEACQRQGVKLGVAFQNRHHPAHVEARRLVSSGLVGEVQMCSAGYSGPVDVEKQPPWRTDPAMVGAGALMGKGVHALDLLRFVVGKEVETVQAMTDEQPALRRLDHTVLVLLKFRQGPFASAVAGWQGLHPLNDLVIHGSKARVRGLGTVGTSLSGQLEVATNSATRTTDFPSNDPRIGTYVLMVEAFNRSVRENTQPNASGQDGLEMARIVQAVLDSGRQGKAVTLLRKMRSGGATSVE